MRLRILVFLCCAIVSSPAVSGGVAFEDGFSFSRLFSSLPIGPLLIVVAILGVLFKAFSRWPVLERWLVGASLLIVPLVGTSNWGVFTGSSSPLRDTALFWTAIALLLGIAWWQLKYRTTILSSPLARAAPAHYAQPETPPLTKPQAERPQASPLQPEPIRAKPATRTNDAIFISYRRQDSADATGRIYDRLVQHFGREQVFKDVDSIPLGVDFREHLGNVVGRCNTLIAVIGPQWKSAAGPNGRRLDDRADFVRVEIEAALARNIPVIPVLVGGASLPADSELPPSIGAIAYRNGINVRPDPDFHRDMDRLIAGLQQHGHG